MDADTPDDAEPIRVGADAAIGSARLAEALASGDEERIGRALRLDVVIIPLVRTEAGALQIRVVQTGGVQTGEVQTGAGQTGAVQTGAGAEWDLPLFSSVAALSAYLAGDPGTDFDVQRGAVLAPFLAEHRALIGRVVFDPAGPHPVAAPVDAVLQALEPRPDDDDVDWISGDGADRG